MRFSLTLSDSQMSNGFDSFDSWVISLGCWIAKEQLHLKMTRVYLLPAQVQVKVLGMTACAFGGAIFYMPHAD